MSRAVVFDVGNVLIEWDPGHVWREDFADDAAFEAFLAEVGFGAWNIEQDRGRSWAVGVAAASAAHPARARLFEKFDREWQRSVPGAIEGSVAILDRLRTAGVPLYAITNFSAEKWAESRERFAFLRDAFLDIVVSAHEGVVKPDPAIFRILFERTGHAAGDLILIDDSRANVAAAEALGMDAILFTGAGALAAALAERGLA